MKIEIKSRYNASILFSLETDSLKLCVEAAVKGGAYLRGADLGGAYLRGADLRGADLRGAKLLAKDGTELLLVGGRAALNIGPIGSRADYLLAFLTDHGVYIKAGCFFDTLATFAAAVQTEHGDSTHGGEYRAAIALIKCHAKHWTPVEAAKETT